MKRNGLIAAIGRAAVVSGLLSVSESLLAQWGPLTGSVTLGLSPSTLAPALGTNFAIDVTIDATGTSGVCETGGGAVPFTFGGFVLGLTFDSSELTFVSAAVCPTTPSQLASPPTCNVLSGNPAEVICQNFNSGNTDQPQGSACVLRLTFTNNGMTSFSPVTLATRRDPAPRSVASAFVATPTYCAGSASFPAASIANASVTLPWNVQVIPATATKVKGTTYTATATVTGNGGLASGQLVSFSVVSGPNVGLTGQGTTNWQGKATFSYTSTVTGTDGVRATITEYGTSLLSNQVSVTWTN